MRYLWLDGFRGVAAIAVALWHFRQPLRIPGFACGFLAVDLFFILSGIVLTLRFADELEGAGNGLQFAWARFRRLYPMALIAGVFALSLNALDVPAGIAQTFGVPATFLILPHAPGQHFYTDFPADPPEWSLYEEVLCNLAWFVALKLGRRFTSTLFVASLVLFAYLAHRHGTLDMGWRPELIEQAKGLVRALSGFGIGYFIARKRFKPNIHAGVAVALFMCACVLFERFPHSIGGFAVVGSGALLLTTLMNSEPAHPLLRQVCTCLGLLSFPLYMIHAPAQRVAQMWSQSGSNVFVAYAVVIVVAGLAATSLNEFIVRRLPSRRPFLN